jgi:hypothetical protein
MANGGHKQRRSGFVQMQKFFSVMTWFYIVGFMHVQVTKFGSMSQQVDLVVFEPNAF